MLSISLTLHTLAAVIWVGGMFFAWMALRPVAAELLEPPLRQRLWRDVFARFFPWVWACVVILPLTGFAYIFRIAGGMGNVGLHVHIMLLLGLIMIALFVYLFFLPYRGLKAAVESGDAAGGGAHLARIRQVVGINLLLGLATAAVAVGGKFWFF